MNMITHGKLLLSYTVIISDEPKFYKKIVHLRQAKHMIKDNDRNSNHVCLGNDLMRSHLKGKIVMQGSLPRFEELCRTFHLNSKSFLEGCPTMFVFFKTYIKRTPSKKVCVIV